jgi:hypothetical protein
MTLPTIRESRQAFLWVYVPSHSASFRSLAKIAPSIHGINIWQLLQTFADSPRIFRLLLRWGTNISVGVFRTQLSEKLQFGHQPPSERSSQRNNLARTLGPTPQQRQR